MKFQPLLFGIIVLTHASAAQTAPVVPPDSWLSTGARPDAQIVRSSKLTVGNVDEAVAQAIALTEDEAQRFQTAIEASRLDILGAFASSGRIEATAANASQLSVLLPPEVARKFRVQFYQKIEQILGTKRLGEFMRLQNMRRFEYGLLFFGEVPVVYEVVGDGATLPDSRNFNIRATFTRTDQFGSYRSFIGSKLPAGNFKTHYGALAVKVLAQSGR